MTNQSTHNDEELKDLAPTLFSISKTEEFSVPEGFFDELNDNLVSEVSDLQELEALAPLFSALPKNDLLLTPEGFFEKFEDKVTSQTGSSEPELTVPEGFFEKQAESLLEKSAQTDPDLGIPETFFEEQHAAIMAAVEEPEKKAGKVVNFKRYRRAILSTAAAAAAVFVVLFAIPTEEEQCVTFACLLEQTDLTADDLLFVDDYDLNEFIDSEEEFEEPSEDEIEMIDYLIESDYDFDELYLEIQ